MLVDWFSKRRKFATFRLRALVKREKGERYAVVTIVVWLLMGFFFMTFRYIARGAEAEGQLARIASEFRADSSVSLHSDYPTEGTHDYHWLLRGVAPYMYFPRWDPWNNPIKVDFTSKVVYMEGVCPSILKVFGYKFKRAFCTNTSKSRVGKDD